MTPAEAAALLTICAAYDNRKPDPDAAKAWAMAMDGYRFEDCRSAVIEHYRVSREWIMPADVIVSVKRARGSRIEDAPPVAIPPGFDPDDTAAYQALLRESRRAQAEGRELEVPEYVPTRHIGELAGVLRKMPKMPLPLPAPKTSEREAAKERARAELAMRPVAAMAQCHRLCSYGPTADHDGSREYRCITEDGRALPFPGEDGYEPRVEGPPMHETENEAVVVECLPGEVEAR